MRHVGHVQTRNRGTVGGSLCQADPAAEIPHIAIVLGAEVTLTSPHGERRMPADDFILGAMDTAIEPDECLTAVSFPVWDEPRLGSAFHEVAMRHGDFALLSASVQVALDADGRCRRIVLGLGNVGSRPQRFDAAATLLSGTGLEADAIEAAMAEVDGAIDPQSDTQATAAYRRRVAPRLLRRAITEAAAEARGGLA